MKKTIFTILIAISIISINVALFGQSVENNWILYPHSVNLNANIPIVTLLPNTDPSYSDSYVDSNGAFDENGNLLFFIVDSEIYDNTGTLVGSLLEANSDYSLLIRETNIVPVPGNNNQYYVIYSRGRPYEGQDVLYATIDCTNGTCTILNNANLLSHYVYGNNNGIAVSRLFSNNTRRMYLASNDFIKRYEISSTAIAFEENILEYPNTYGLASYDFDAFQLEISNDCSKLAWGSIVNMTVRSESFLPKLNIIELDDDGSFSNYYSILPSDDNFVPTWQHTIKGVEFASDNSKVYFNVSDGNRTGGIFCYNFDLELLSNVIYDEYNVTQLQSDANGYIYAVSNAGDNLGRIDPTTNTITTDYLDIDIFSTTEAGGWFLYTLPDLIDYNSIMALTTTTTYESCASESDGTASVTVSGGVPPYTYLWDDPLAQTTSTAVNLSPGIYTCIVTDAFNTSLSISVEIVTDPSLFTHIGDWDVYTLDGINGFAAVDGIIEIFDGGTFIIDGNIEFNENSGIIVHNGGVLDIYNNSVLSGLTECNNNFWAGVSIEEQGTLIADIDNFTISKGNLIIEAGAEVSFSANTVYFENNNLIVKQKGKLVLNNNILTTVAGKTWRGIQVWGNSTLSQYPDPNTGAYQQGFLELNNATIKNAVCAADLWKPDDYSTTGGIIYAENSKFVNCTKAVHALYYKNYNPYDPDQNEEPYNAVFKLDTFQITPVYQSQDMFYKHVDLSHVKGIDFKACYFSKDASANNVSDYDIGIAGYNAGFNVKDICTSQVSPCPDSARIPSFFNGFYSGVLADGDLNNGNIFNVYNSEFINNIYGVKAAYYNNSTLIGSNYEIGYNDSPEAMECVKASGYGIWTDHCTGFAIEENHFSKYSGAPSAIYTGISISNTNAADEVYKNYFDGVSYANYSEGHNWSGNWTFEGLAYYCNQNNLNYADFYVSLDDQNVGGIQSIQGDLSHATGNTFSPGSAYDFYNGGVHQVGYYYNENGTNEPPDINKVHHVTPYKITDVNQCDSHYGGDTRGNLLLSSQQRQDAEQQFSNNLVDYSSVKTLYDNLKDGGSTTSEISDIENAQPSDMWSLRSQLLGDSPHLSMDVLKKTADRTDVFPDATIFDILAANPDELKKDELIKYLEEKENPLPQYMIDILKELANGSTYKTILERQMAYYNQRKTRAANDIIRSIINDSIVDYTDLRNWLDNRGGIVSDRQIISSYLQQGNYTDALNLANMLPTLYNLKGTDSIEHLYYMDMLTLFDTLFVQGRNTEQLDSTELAQVIYIADSSNDVAGAQARAILESVYGYHFTCCQQLSDSTTGYKAGRHAITGQMADAYGISISANPNPASSWVSFNYTLRYEKSKAVIEVSDVAGRVVASLNVHGKQGQKVLDTREIHAGAYIYTLKTEGFVKSGKLIIN